MKKISFSYLVVPFVSPSSYVLNLGNFCLVLAVFFEFWPECAGSGFLFPRAHRVQSLVSCSRTRFGVAQARLGFVLSRRPIFPVRSSGCRQGFWFFAGLFSSELVFVFFLCQS
jgi:hypothetical protein